MTSHIPKLQPPKISIKGYLQQQLKGSQVNLSLFELLQQSKDHKDVMNQLLQMIKIDINSPQSFVTFMGNIKTS